MSITAPPASRRLSWRPERPVLPAPTGDEVAAVRARTEARAGRRTRRTRRADAVAAIGLVIVLGAFVGLFALDIATDGAFDGSRWGVLLVGTVQSLVLARGVRHSLRVDAAVRRRLAAEGTVVSPAVEPPSSRADRILAGAAVAALVVAVAGLVGLAARDGSAGAWGQVACVAALTGLGLRQAWQIGRAGPVGASAVLRAVDGVLLRRDLAIALAPSWFLVLFSTSSLSRGVHGPLVVLPLAGVAVTAFVGVAVLVRDDGWVLRDHRIATATPPPVWLEQA